MADKKQFNLVGKRVAPLDSWSKVTGEAVYTDDIKLPGMLVGKILRSPHPHAKIVRIDTSKASAMAGVRAIVTGREPGAEVKFGVLPISKDETAMAVEKTKYIGDCVAGVAADDEETALAACEAIEVEYSPLPAYLDPEKCLEKVAVKIHDSALGDTNVHKAVDQNFGDPEGAFARSAHVVTGRFDFGGINHGFTEPHCVIAHYEPDGRLTIYTPTQVGHYLHRALADVMRMPMHRIRVVKPIVGGAFGGKSDPFPHEMIASMLARQCGKPVKILFDREEVFLTNHGRHPTIYKIKVACDKQGKLTALDANSLIDGGAWGSFGVVTTYYNGVLSQGPYRFPNFKYSGRRVYTNKAPCGAMRGHGAVNARFALETSLDQLAEQAGLDPIDFRLQNVLEPGQKTINEFRITSIGIKECLEKARAASGWDKKFRQLPYGRGIGLGCGFYISGSLHPIHRAKWPQSTVHLKLDMDGGVTVHSMASDIGQSSDTMLAQCVAEPLGIPISRVRVKAQDSDLAPVDLGSYSSRQTFMSGNAAKQAAEVILGKLQRAASKLTGRPAEKFICRDEKVVDRDDPNCSVPFLDALHEAMADNGALIAKGRYLMPKGIGGQFKGAAAGLSPSYSYQAFICEVEVDPETGFIKPIKVWAAHDCGRALNPVAVEGQIEGSVYMGMGQALCEDMRYLKGQLLNPSLLDYKTLTPLDVPPIETIIVESDDPEGPFGAKECGEGALAPIIPAIANAVYDAVGVRLTEVPMTPEVVLAALEKQKERTKPTRRVPTRV